MEDNNMPNGKYPKFAGLIIGLLALVVGLIQYLPDKGTLSTGDIVSEQVVIQDSDYEDEEEKEDAEYVDYFFRNEELLNSHYEKHGKEMGFKDGAAYEKAASDVVNNKEALHRVEAEDGDDVYYMESTNEFVVVSTDGYIRTYFEPDDGIEYFNRQ